MMASHRPTDPPTEPQVVAPPQPSAPKPTTLGPSAFLAGFDHVLAIGVLVLAFLLASFVVRNSDFFMHIAAGRLIVEGNYSFGKDPFSYVDSERTWVNHAWLFDVGLYLTYKMLGGGGLVVLKASLVALLAGILLLTRKPGQSLWPAAIGVGLAMLAAAPRFNVQPMLASYFCFAVLLFMLLRMPRAAASWRFPVSIGILFWFWSNCDQWFFLGPMTLLLYTAGQYLRKDEGECNQALWKALMIGVVACMLNPHHVRVWTLPPELINRAMADIVADDAEFSAFFQSAFTKGAVDFGIGAERDNPANTYGLVLVIVLNLAGCLLNWRRVSLSLLLVWVGTFTIWLLHLRAVPYLAFTSAVMAGTNWAAIGERWSTRTFSDGTARVLHMLRSFGRAGTALVGLLLIALTYPGWLHPLNFQRRWGWDVEPSVSMVNAAKKLQEWRDTGVLPPEAHLLNLQPDFANYVAWYAPSEKSFFDYRFGFHADELQDYVDLRKYLGPGMDAAKQKKLGFDFTAFLRKHNIVYTVTAHTSRGRNMSAFLALNAPATPEGSEPDWTLLNVDGRSLILSWNRQTLIPRAKLEALRFDPVKLAYANVTPLKKIDNLRTPTPERDIWDRFVVAPPSSPPTGDEVLFYLDYRERLLNQLKFEIAKEIQPTIINGWNSLVLANREMGKKGKTSLVLNVLFSQIRPEGLLEAQINKLAEERLPPEINALSILSIRAARRAIMESPNHPDGYYFLTRAYRNGGAVDTMGLSGPVAAASLARHIARMPTDPQQRRSSIAIYRTAFELEGEHANARPPRVDMQLAASRISLTYLGYEVQLREAEPDRLNTSEQQETEAFRRELESKEKRIKIGEEQVQKLRDQYINQVAQQSVPVLRAAVARNYGLAQEALDELMREIERIGKDRLDGSKSLTLKEMVEQFATYAELAELLLYAGRAEEAMDLLDHIDQPAVYEQLQRPEVIGAYANLRMMIAQSKRIGMIHDNNPVAQFRYLRHWAALVVGDYDKVQSLLEQSLTATRQGFTNHRQELLAKAVKNPPEGYGNEQLHRDLTLLAKDQRLTGLHALVVPKLLQHGNLALPTYFTITNNTVLRYFELLTELGEAHVRLALAYLEQGDMTTAKFHFTEATKLPALPVEPPALRLAKRYLKSIP